MTRQEIEHTPDSTSTTTSRRMLADSDARLIESITDGSISLAVATETMAAIHAAAREAIPGLVDQAIARPRTGAAVVTDGMPGGRDWIRVRAAPATRTAVSDCPWRGHGAQATVHHARDRRHRILLRDAPHLGPVTFGGSPR